MAKLAGINNLIVGQYDRVVVVAALQNISDIIDDESIWAISLVGNSSTYHGQSFFDLCLCAFYCGDFMNLHLDAIPMFERHITENMFNMVVKFLDALYDRWCDKLIKVSSNGENTTTGRHSGFVMCMFNSLLTRCCAFGARHIRLILSSKLRLNQSWTTLGSNSHTVSRYFCGRKTIL